MSKIVSVGTPTNTHATSGSITGTWGAGQNRSVGNLLVALMVGGATTSVTTLATPAGWTNLVANGNAATANIRFKMCTKDATGGDAAPATSSTLTGTGAMDMILFELAGAEPNATCFDGVGADAAHQYLSGATAITLSNAVFTVGPFTPAYSDEEYAICCFMQERAAASLTFTDGSTGWTKILNGNGVSSILQTAVIVRTPGWPSPHNPNGAFSTNTTAFGCVQLLTFRAAREPQKLAARRPVWPANRELAAAYR